MNETVFTIPEGNLVQLRAEIASLNKIAAKLDLPLILLNILDEETRTKTHDITGSKTYYRVFKVEVLGASPAISGWKFLATINRDRGLGTTIVRQVPYADPVPPTYHTANHRQCDHCHVDRARNDVFVIKNVETGEHQQVGRTCLKDFLGHGDPATIAKFFERIHVIYNLGGDGEGGERNGGPNLLESSLFDLDEVLATTSAIIRKEGWVSGKMASETGGIATSHRVYDYLWPRSAESADWRHGIEVTDGDKAIAVRAVEHTKAISDAETQNSYHYNIREIARIGRTNIKQLGFACSILTFYSRTVRETVDANTDGKLNEHVGPVGTKINTVATVLTIRYVEGQFGSTAVVNLEDAQGRRLTWFSSSKPAALDDAEGKSFRITGTIKKLGEFRGTKQTTITRARLVAA